MIRDQKPIIRLMIVIDIFGIGPAHREACKSAFFCRLLVMDGEIQRGQTHTSLSFQFQIFPKVRIGNTVWSYNVKDKSTGRFAFPKLENNNFMAFWLEQQYFCEH